MYQLWKTGESGAGASPAFACNLLLYAEEVGEEKLPNFYFLLLFCLEL